ncbi:chlorohydrolase family protein [Microbacterium hydrocarbonoxydans]|uniref:chlorohydrolase family protein n=1 Tax=Microbacterium hydrocarbonoxydans TaxID=273678 RepID=UPI0013DBF99C|nr:chlorohydrolase family protein [Microbacterium hydrocarbonoxydans]
MRTLLTADHVLACEDGRFRELRDAAVLVDGDSIRWVGPVGRAAAHEFDERIDLGQALLMPGLIDLEGLADIDHLQLDSWRDDDGWAELRWSRAYAESGPAGALSPEDRRLMRRYAVAQLALHGITTFMPIAAEVHTAWAETHDDLVDVARAAQELGLRAWLGPSYRSGVPVTEPDGAEGVAWDEARGEAGLAEAVRFLDTIAGWGDPLLTGVLAPCRIEHVTEELLRETARVSADRDVLVRVHALQELGEREHFARTAGTTQLGLLERTGLLGPRLLVAHGVYLDVHPDVHGEDRGELAALAAAGASVVHCPLTNARYAFLLEDLSQYLEAGVNIAMGTDSFPPDLIRAIDHGVQLSKAQHGDLSRGMLAEYVQAATLGGATALRRPDLGRIEAGAAADVVAFALDDIRIGAVEDPLRTLVLAGTARDARFSMVAGRVVLRDGVLPGVDMEELRREGQRIFGILRDSYADRSARTATVDEIFPAVFPVRR